MKQSKFFLVPSAHVCFTPLVENLSTPLYVTDFLNIYKYITSKHQKEKHFNINVFFAIIYFLLYYVYALVY